MQGPVDAGGLGLFALRVLRATEGCERSRTRPTPCSLAPSGGYCWENRLWGPKAKSDSRAQELFLLAAGENRPWAALGGRGRGD